MARDSRESPLVRERMSARSAAARCVPADVRLVPVTGRIVPLTVTLRSLDVTLVPVVKT